MIDDRKNIVMIDFDRMISESDISTDVHDIDCPFVISSIKIESKFTIVEKTIFALFLDNFFSLSTPHTE